jgi:hypothetical protein
LKRVGNKKTPISAQDVQDSIKKFNKQMPSDFAGLVQAEKVVKK